jgi:putative transposase
MSRAAYPTDLSDAQWIILDPLLKCPREHGGKPPDHPLREIVNAMLYLLRSGCSWRNLPHDFPPPDAVYSYFRRWRKNGKLDRVHDALREQVRQSEGREATPSAAVIDSQSVPTTEKGGSVGTTRARRSRAGSGTSS